MKLRTSDPWMSAKEYSHSLSGLTLNLLVHEIARSVNFATEILGATVVYSDADFAVLRHRSSEWMLHADHAYVGHPHAASLGGTEVRGLGLELRLHHQDPDVAEAAARTAGYVIPAPSTDKPHGLREVHILDPDGYCWVLDVPIPSKA